MELIALTESMDSVDKNAERDIGRIDRECASCLYEAAKAAVEDVLAAVIETELTEQERTVLRMYWFGNMKISQIALKTDVSHRSAKNTLNNAQKKIYTYLKYVVLFNNMLDGKTKLPENFHFKIINCINGKELIS